jgi:hypothetical protein
MVILRETDLTPASTYNIEQSGDDKYCWNMLQVGGIMYEGNSKSKVAYFIPAERIPALSWQSWVQLVHIFTIKQQQ